jgi:cystathionine beta-lyase/cystathionine gamma-synthase
LIVSNALKVAEFLDKHPKKSFVTYHSLENHENHQVASSQMSPVTGVYLHLDLMPIIDTHNNFVSHLNLITSAVSLGHNESRIVFLGENDERQHLYPEKFQNGFFRLSVGIQTT